LLLDRQREGGAATLSLRARVECEGNTYVVTTVEAAGPEVGIDASLRFLTEVKLLALRGQPQWWTPVVYRARYATEAQARAGHDRIAAAVRQGLPAGQGAAFVGEAVVGQTAPAEVRPRPSLGQRARQIARTLLAAWRRRSG
jgi:hypothetical protein